MIRTFTFCHKQIKPKKLIHYNFTKFKVICLFHSGQSLGKLYTALYGRRRKTFSKLSNVFKLQTTIKQDRHTCERNHCPPSMHFPGLSMLPKLYSPQKCPAPLSPAIIEMRDD